MNKFLIIIFLFFLTHNINSEQISKDVYINSENIYHDKKAEKIYLGKNSLLNYQTTSISTDEGIIDTKNKTIKIDSNFYLNYLGDIMKGNFLDADLNFKKGTAKNINYIYQKNLKINSKTLEKKDNYIIFKESFLTPCDIKGFFNCPTWALKIKKTNYNIEEDYFKHYNTFIQIADRKMMYLPYLSHYGSKAGRKRGFLTPKTQLVNALLGGNITTPYYLPLSESSDIKITPNFYYETGFTNYFKNKIEFRSKISEGDINVTIDNHYDSRKVGQVIKSYALASSANLNLNEKNKISLNLNYASNVSEYKSNSDTRSASLDSNITLNSYNLINNNDLLISKFSGNKNLTDTTNSSNPYSFTSKYMNYVNLKNNIILSNKVKIDLIVRQLSTDYLPNRILRTNILNTFQKNLKINKNYNLINKFIFDTSGITVEEGKDNTNIIPGSSSQITTYASSEINKVFKINNKYKIKPRTKLIIENSIKGKNLNVNDNSQSLSFNYNNLFEENRYFGSDKKENGSRIVASIEQKYNVKNVVDLEMNYGRVYNIGNKNNLMTDINQKSNFSDHLLEMSLKYKGNNIKYTSRYDKENLKLKEDFISYQFENDKNSIAINKNITNESAFTNSESTHFMTLKYGRKINSNSRFIYENEIDLNDKSAKSFNQEYRLEFFDECSSLSFNYSMDNYNDGKQLKPNKTFEINFQMNFLGLSDLLLSDL